MISFTDLLCLELIKLSTESYLIRDIDPSLFLLGRLSLNLDHASQLAWDPCQWRPL